jgi:hypothetical protein
MPLPDRLHRSPVAPPEPLGGQFASGQKLTVFTSSTLECSRGGLPPFGRYQAQIAPLPATPKKTKANMQRSVIGGFTVRFDALSRCF